VKWLTAYGSLDGVMANADKITGVVGENLRRAWTGCRKAACW
jgi:DNA polymerase-1